MCSAASRGMISPSQRAETNSAALSQSMGTSFRLSTVPNGAQRLAGREQARADRADGNVEDGGEFGVRLAFDLAQPEQRALVGGQAAQSVRHHGGGFRPAETRTACVAAVRPNAVCIDRISGPVLPAPLSRLLPSDAEEPCPKGSAIGVEGLRPSPDLGECFLHHILRRLRIAEKVPEEGAQARSVLAVPAIEGLRIARGDLLPEFPVVQQFGVSNLYFGAEPEKVHSAHKYPKIADAPITTLT